MGAKVLRAESFYLLQAVLFRLFLLILSKQQSGSQTQNIFIYTIDIELPLPTHLKFSTLEMKKSEAKKLWKGEKPLESRVRLHHKNRFQYKLEKVILLGEKLVDGWVEFLKKENLYIASFHPRIKYTFIGTSSSRECTLFIT
jgi:hypothetical protein